MEYRAEPRFPVRSPIQVIVPGDPARILSCELVNVSATGMRFVVDETVTPDEIVAVEVDSRLMLAEVRYCQPRGDKFAVGVRRLQEIPKGAELRDSAACATEMIRHLRRHISAGGERDPKALAQKALEKIVARGEIAPAGQESTPEPGRFELLTPEPISPPSVLRATGEGGETPAIEIPNARELHEMAAQEPVRAVPIEVRAINVTHGTAADAPVGNGSDEIEYHEPVAAVPTSETRLQERVETISAEVLSAVLPEVLHGDVLEGDVLEGDVIKGDDPDEPLADVPAEPVPAGIEFRAQVVAERPPGAEAPSVVSEGRMTEPVAEAAEIAEAEEVGNVAAVLIALRAPTSPGIAQEADPLAARRAEIGASYLAGDASGILVRRSRSWRAPAAIAAALVLACAITFFLVQRRTQAGSPAPPVEVPTAKVDPAPAPAAPAAPTVPPASISPPDKTPAKKAGVHHVEIKVVNPSWIGIVADGGKLYQTVLYKGGVHEFDFSKNAVLRLGHAAGVEITLDNAHVGPLKGTVLQLQLTPHGVEFPKMPPLSPTPPR